MVRQYPNRRRSDKYIKISKRSTYGALLLALVSVIMSPSFLNIIPDNASHYIPLITTFIASLGSSIRD